MAELVTTNNQTVCAACGCTDEVHDCIGVILGRARLLIVHYGHSFAEHDKQDALVLIDQMENVITRRGAAFRAQRFARGRGK